MIILIPFEIRRIGRLRRLLIEIPHRIAEDRKGKKRLDKRQAVKSILLKSRSPSGSIGEHGREAIERGGLVRITRYGKVGEGGQGLEGLQGRDGTWQRNGQSNCGFSLGHPCRRRAQTFRGSSFAFPRKAPRGSRDR